MSQSPQVLPNWQTQPGSSHLHLLCILWDSCTGAETVTDLFAGEAMSHVFDVEAAAQKKNNSGSDYLDVLPFAAYLKQKYKPYTDI